MDNFNKSRHMTEISNFRKSLAKEMRGDVLDVGGGLGIYLPYFGGETTVMDISQEALNRLDYPKKVIGDAIDMPFPDESFDSVFAMAVCQYFDLSVFVSQVKRVLRKGGRCTILVPNGKSPWDKVKKVFGLRTWDQQEGIFKQYCANDLKKYGKVYGEIRFLLWDGFARNHPNIGHCLILKFEK